MHMQSKKFFLDRNMHSKFKQKQTQISFIFGIIVIYIFQQLFLLDCLIHCFFFSSSNNSFLAQLDRNLHLSFLLGYFRQYPYLLIYSFSHLGISCRAESQLIIKLRVLLMQFCRHSYHFVTVVWLILTYG